MDRTVAQVLWGAELVQHCANPPGLCLPLVRWQGTPHCLVQGQGEEAVGDILLHQPHAHEAGLGDAASARLDGAGQAAQEGGFATAIAGNQADPVTVGQIEGEVLKEDARRRDANFA